MPEDRLVALHVVQRETFACFGRMIRQLGFALGEEGVRVALLTDDGGLAASVTNSALAAIPIPAFTRWNLWRTRDAIPARLEAVPDIVHCWSLRTARLAQSWAHAWDALLTVYLSDEAEVEQCLRHFPDVDGVAVACPAFAERIRGLSRGAAAALEPFLLTPALLAPARPPEGAAGGRELSVLWFGEFVRGCGIETLLAAAAAVRQRQVDLQLALIGSGPLERSFWKRVRAAQQNDWITITNAPALWDEVLTGVDALVVPACQRRLTLAPLVAMSLGSLVIATSDQIAPWFVDGQTAAMIAPGDASALAERLIGLHDRQPHLRALARGAADYVRARHRVSAVAAATASWYRSLATVATGGGRGS